MKELKKLKEPMKPILKIKKYEDAAQFLIQRKPFDHLIRDLTRKKNTSLTAKGALANRLQRRPACKIQNGH